MIYIRPLTEAEKTRIRNDTMTSLAQLRIWKQDSRSAHRVFDARRAWTHGLIVKANADFKKLLSESNVLRYSRTLPRYL